jgi:hypothetical protein
MIKIKDVWHDNIGCYMDAADAKTKPQKVDVPHGSPEAKRIIQQVREQERKRGESK